MSIPHGVMFHHFCNNKKLAYGDGAYTEEKLHKLILSIKKNFIILEPQEFLYEIKKKTKDIICFTFDDNLLSQYKIALNILNHFNIKAFWFIYSSTFQNKRDYFEIYRRFRKNYFKNFNEFYLNFIETTKIQNYTINEINESDIFKEIKNNYNFYTEKEIIFRILRDKYLTNKDYKKTMNKMIKENNISYKTLSKNLWMNNKHIKKLSMNGHEIGLHGYNHEVLLGKLSYDKQFISYFDNYNHIKKITEKKPISASYPSNSFNSNTIKILKKLDIKISFCSSSNILKRSYAGSNYLIPRREPFDEIYR